MKKLLLALTLGLGLSVNAQDAIKTSFQTTQIESSIMTYNEVEKGWDFEDNDDMQPFEAFWTFNLGRDGKGGYFNSGKFIYSIFDWEFTETGTLINFYAHELKEEGTLIIVVRGDGRNSMTFFLPETNRSMTFHQSVK